MFRVEAFCWHYGREMMDNPYLCRAAIQKQGRCGGNLRSCQLRRKQKQTKQNKKMADNNQQQQQGFSIELKPEVAQGVYANLALITHSSSDFILDFACMLPGVPKPTVRSRVIMAPEHAKRLLQALQENVYKYEQQFGKIQLPGMEGGRTIAPFGVGKGEA